MRSHGPPSRSRSASRLHGWCGAPLVGILLSTLLPVGCGDVGAGDRTVTEPTAARNAFAEVDLPDGIDVETMDPVLLESARERIRATTAEPESAAAWASLADLWLAHARYDLAVDPAGRAVELAPESPRRRLVLAVALENAGELDAALDSARRAVELDRGDASLAWWVSGLALDAGELEEAEALAVSALQLDPGDTTGVHALVMVQLAEGDAAAALASIEPLVRADPSDQASRFLFGRALQAAGRTDEATRQLMVAGASRPVFVHPWIVEIREGRVDRNQRIQDVARLASEGRLDEALALSDELESIYGPEREIRFSRVVVNAIAGRHEEVLKEADAIIADEPDWAAPRLRAGLASLAIAMRTVPPGGTGVARARMEGSRCIELAPGDAESHELLGRSHAAVGAWAEALPSFRKCLDLQPSVARYHVAVGDCLVETGAAREGLNLMRRMNQAFGRSVDATLVEARALASLGRTEDARRLLEGCRQAMPGHPGVARTARYIAESGG